jgi:hypothetical protein
MRGEHYGGKQEFGGGRGLRRNNEQGFSQYVPNRKMETNSVTPSRTVFY